MREFFVGYSPEIIILVIKFITQNITKLFWNFANKIFKHILKKYVENKSHRICNNRKYTKRC